MFFSSESIFFNELMNAIKSSSYMGEILFHLKITLGASQTTIVT